MSGCWLMGYWWVSVNGNKCVLNAVNPVTKWILQDSRSFEINRAQTGCNTAENISAHTYSKSYFWSFEKSLMIGSLVDLVVGVGFPHELLRQKISLYFISEIINHYISELVFRCRTSPDEAHKSTTIYNITILQIIQMH